MKHETEIKEAIVHLGEEGLEAFKELYDPCNILTWYFKPIEIPLINGEGPCRIVECNELKYEVWDVFCNTIAQFTYLSDCINYTLELNKGLLDWEKDQ